MCPLCGLHHSIGKYEPENLPLDIEAVLKVGLGRGKGTRVVERYSLLWDDDVCPKIVKRVLALCKLFLDQKLVTQSDLKRSLGIVDALQPRTVSLREYNKLNEDVETLKVNLEMEDKRADRESNRADRETSRANSLQVTVNSLNGKLRDLEPQISNSISSRSSLRKEFEELKVEKENSNQFLDDVIETIEERTKFWHNPLNDTREIFIANVISKLLEDNEALIADDEQ